MLQQVYKETCYGLHYILDILIYSWKFLALKQKIQYHMHQILTLYTNKMFKINFLHYPTVVIVRKWWKVEKTKSE